MGVFRVRSLWLQSWLWRFPAVRPRDLSQKLDQPEEAGPARRSRLGHLADPFSNCWHLLNLLKVFSKYSFKPDSTLCGPGPHRKTEVELDSKQGPLAPNNKAFIKSYPEKLPVPTLKVKLGWAPTMMV